MNINVLGDKTLKKMFDEEEKLKKELQEKTQELEAIEQEMPRYTGTITDLNHSIMNLRKVIELTPEVGDKDLEIQQERLAILQEKQADMEKQKTDAENKISELNYRIVEMENQKGFRWYLLAQAKMWELRFKKYDDKKLNETDNLLLTQLREKIKPYTVTGGGRAMIVKRNLQKLDTAGM